MEIKNIDTYKVLANYLRCQTNFIIDIVENGYLIYDSKIHTLDDLKLFNKKSLVNKFYIPKKNKKNGYRIVYSPYYDVIANSLKILNNHLTELYHPLDCVHGFIKGRSIKTNATPHLEKKYTLSLDIENFFESIPQNVVKENFEKIGFSEKTSLWLSNITCVNGKLIQGFNTSPTIANMIVRKMDEELISLVGQEVIYTRYADDLYFSTDSKLPDIKKIDEILRQNGFIINENKTKIMKRGQNQFITGLTVFDNKMPRIPKKIKRNLRLEIFFIKKYGYELHVARKLGFKWYNKTEIKINRRIIQIEIEKTQQRLIGWIHFINSIEPEFGSKLYKSLTARKKIQF
jgi:RNA-directed DNA polymerase